MDGAEYDGMEPERIYTYDDELHQRRRRLAIVRPPIDFQSERLKRLKDRSKDTRDP
ncbi:MAG: hypothetical protein ACRDHF_04220 [Tepidiformaceae bacterium]